MNRKKLLVTGLCTAAIVGLGSVGASAEEKIAPKTLEFLEATTISGYVQASYVLNVDGGAADNNRRNGRDPGYTSGTYVNHWRAFDNDEGFTLNAIKLVLEKPLGEGDWAAGYRVDLLFGDDATQLNRAEGSSGPFFDADDDNPEEQGMGLYLEQGYVAFRVPVGNGIDFKFGRFVALSGYEVIEGPANLNFSRGLLFTFAEPLGYTGILAAHRWNDTFDTQIGLVNGWNSWSEDDNVSPALITRQGFRNSSGTFSLGVSTFLGDARTSDTAFGGIGTSASTLRYVNGVMNWKPTEKVLIGADSVFGVQQKAVNNHHTEQFWGVGAYGKVQATEKVYLAGRAEYLHARHGAIFGINRSGFDPNIVGDPGAGSSPKPVNTWEVTGTIGIDVWKNLLMRFEGRVDQASAPGPAADSPFHPQGTQVTLSADASYSF